MNLLKQLQVATFLSVAMLTPFMASAVTLGAYENARNDPARQTQILKHAYDSAVASTIIRLRSSTFTDGKVKTPQRIEKDGGRADRIDRMAPHLTDRQKNALTSMIGQYAAAQPNTELEDVITGFLLTEAQTPYERYLSAYKEFMTEANGWNDAINESQVELTVEKLSLNDRRKRLDTSGGATGVPIASVEVSMKSFHTAPVIKQWIASLLAPTDSSGHAKPLDGIDADKQRATIVLDIGKHYDTDEVARRIFAAMKSGASIDTQMIFSGYVHDELVRRETAVPGSPH